MKNVRRCSIILPVDYKYYNKIILHLIYCRLNEGGLVYG